MHTRACTSTLPRFVRAVRLLLTLALLVPLAQIPMALAQPAPTRVGYVDMQRLLDNAPQVMAANARLKKEFDARDAELTADQARLAEMDARLKSGGAENTDALQRQADALRRSVERTRQRLRDELRTRSGEEVDKTWPLINDAVADYAREQGYDLVVPSPVVYVSGRIDITDDVIERMRREFDQSGQ